MLIQSLERKTRLALMTVLLTIVGNVVICGMLIAYGAKVLSEERNQVYVLDGDIPFLAQRSQEEANFVMEAKAHIQLFHQYFFTLPPDDFFICYMYDYVRQHQARRTQQEVYLLWNPEYSPPHQEDTANSDYDRGTGECAENPEQSAWLADYPLANFKEY